VSGVEYQKRKAQGLARLQARELIRANTAQAWVSLFRGFAVGLGFCWLLGFAVGYESVLVPMVLASLVVSFMVLAREFGR
jgi:uncharacterized membrane protein (Fun14 family)